MPFIEREGVRIFYDAHGQGAPVLLTHGYGATSQMWAGQVAAFLAQYRIIVWDMRGHGRSDYPESLDEYSEQATVDDMAAILDECQVERAFIGGLSLGGYMSLAFHHAYPRRTRALLLFDTGPGYKSDTGRDH